LNVVIRPRLLLIAALLLFGRLADGQPIRLVICGRPAVDRKAARLLERWIPSIRVEVVSGCDRCRPRDETYRGWFARTGNTVELRLVSRTGVLYRRTIGRAPGLAQLAEQGELARFAVILQGVIVEHELGWLLEDSPRAPQGADTTVQSQLKRKIRPRRTGLLDETLSSLTALAAGHRPPKQQPKPETAVRNRAAAPIGPALGFVGNPQIAAPEPAQAIAADPLRQQTARTEVSTVRHPPNDEPGVGRPPNGTDAPTRSATRSGVRLAAPVAKVVRREQGGSASHLSIQSRLAARWRSGGLWSLEVGGRLGWRSLFLGAGYQLAATWSLEGRPVEVRAVPLEAGWRPELWRRRAWLLEAEIAMLLEHLMLRRADLAQATTHGHWDVGLAAGLMLAYRSTSGLGAGIGAEVCLFPAAKEIEIANGPSARLSVFGVRTAFFLEWRSR
jgi:hypothetical protein